jgi:FdhE protein
MDILEELIAQKPHLEEPLRFYEKSVQFTDGVRALSIPSGTGLKAYPSMFIGPIIERFLSVFDLPEGSLAPLQQALELEEIDFTRLPLLEVPAFSLPYPEDDLTLLLFLLSRPYFFGMHDVLPFDDRIWEDGQCPVCKARPALSSITPEGRQQLYCSFCGTKGLYDAIGCHVCHNNNVARMDISVFENEAGFTVRTCNVCRCYVKIVAMELLGRMSPDLADLISLPIDIVVQNAGYKRSSPNAIGMARMSASG